MTERANKERDLKMIEWTAYSWALKHFHVCRNPNHEDLNRFFVQLEILELFLSWKVVWLLVTMLPKLTKKSYLFSVNSFYQDRPTQIFSLLIFNQLL